MGLAQLGVRPEQLVWIDAKGPADRLWVTEQLVKSDPVGAVLAWLPQARPEQIRRLQLNAHSCDAPVFLFRPETAVRDTSAAPLRLSVKPGMGWQIDVQIIKRRGAPLEEILHLDAMPSNLGIVIPPRLRNLVQPALIPGSEVTHVLGRFSPAQLDGVRVAN
jgi:protein ImuA